MHLWAMVFGQGIGGDGSGIMGPWMVGTVTGGAWIIGKGAGCGPQLHAGSAHGSPTGRDSGTPIC